jgi:hypothetical protein
MIPLIPKLIPKKYVAIYDFGIFGIRFHKFGIPNSIPKYRKFQNNSTIFIWNCWKWNSINSSFSKKI